MKITIILHAVSIWFLLSLCLPLSFFLRSVYLLKVRNKQHLRDYPKFQDVGPKHQYQNVRGLTSLHFEFPYKYFVSMPQPPCRDHHPERHFRSSSDAVPETTDNKRTCEPDVSNRFQTQDLVNTKDRFATSPIHNFTTSPLHIFTSSPYLYKLQ